MLCLYVYNVLPPQRLPGSFEDRLCNGQRKIKETRFKKKKKKKKNNCPTNGTVGFYSAVLRSKDADRITNRVDTDQTAPRGAVWSGSALFSQTYLSQYFKLLR